MPRRMCEYNNTHRGNPFKGLCLVYIKLALPGCNYHNSGPVTITTVDLSYLLEDASTAPIHMGSTAGKLSLLAIAAVTATATAVYIASRRQGQAGEEMLPFPSSATEGGRSELVIGK